MLKDVKNMSRSKEKFFTDIEKLTNIVSNMLVLDEVHLAMDSQDEQDRLKVGLYGMNKEFQKSDGYETKRILDTKRSINSSLKK